MIRTNVSIEGADKIIRRLGTITTQLAVEIKDIVEDVTIAIERQAISNAPVAGEELATKYGTQTNQTGINGLIEHKYLNNGNIGIVYVADRAGNLPIYIEFGTGSSAAGYVPTLPKWAQEIARKYYISGNGTLIKKPYLLPAYFQHSPELYRKLKELVRRQRM